MRSEGSKTLLACQALGSRTLPRLSFADEPAKIAVVKSPDLAEVFRAYLRERVQGIGPNEFERLTKIPHGDVSKALKVPPEKGVSMGQINRIAQTVGPRLSQILTRLQKIAAEVETGARDLDADAVSYEAQKRTDGTGLRREGTASAEEVSLPPLPPRSAHDRSQDLKPPGSARSKSKRPQHPKPEK